MKILFIGPKFGNSYLLFKTFKKMFKYVDIIDTEKILYYPKISNKIFYHITPSVFESYIKKYIFR